MSSAGVNGDQLLQDTIISSLAEPLTFVGRPLALSVAVRISNYLGEKLQQCDGPVIDCHYEPDSVSGDAHTAHWLVAERLVASVPAAIVRRYAYDERWKLADVRPWTFGARALTSWEDAAVSIVLGQMSVSSVEGSVPLRVLSNTAGFLDAALDWSEAATSEALYLLLARLVESEHFLGDGLSFHSAESLRESTHTSCRFPNAVWQLMSSNLAPLHKDIFFPSSSVSLDADLDCWRRLAEGFIRKQWHKHYVSFASFWRRSPLREQLSKIRRERLTLNRSQRLKKDGAPIDDDSETDLILELAPDEELAEGLSDLAWLALPYRDVVVHYVEDPAIAFDEFVDLSGLWPPTGYFVKRRLSYATGFKIVYDAVDPDGRPVALKRYQDWNTERARELLRNLGLSKDEVIQKDALTHWLGEIRHTHILPSTVQHNVAGEVFIVEPLLEMTLDKLVVEGPQHVLTLMHEACEGLAFLHYRGLVHSDLKPDNIGIERGNAVLLDFGIATMHSSTKAGRRNPGSLKTRAPELFNDNAVPTWASDVWSFGATLMGLATGGEYPLVTRAEIRALPQAGDPRRRPFEETIIARLGEYRLNPAKLDARIRNTVGAEFTSVAEIAILACQLNPNERPSADDLLKLLKRALNQP